MTLSPIERVLIVNADDFGLSKGVNRGIVKAHVEGIVTSASLMVRRPGAEDAARLAAAHPALSLGLHLELPDLERAAEDAERQLDAFRALVGDDPTHLDSHHHRHLEEPAREVVAEIGERLGVPVRGLAAGVRYCDEFFGIDAIGVSALISLLHTLPPGVTELGCHPGLGADYASSYFEERAQEVATLCDPRVRTAVADAGIELRSFRDLRGWGG